LSKGSRDSRERSLDLSPFLEGTFSFGGLFARAQFLSLLRLETHRVGLMPLLVSTLLPVLRAPCCRHSRKGLDFFSYFPLFGFRPSPRFGSPNSLCNTGYFFGRSLPPILSVYSPRPCRTAAFPMFTLKRQEMDELLQPPPPSQVNQLIAKRSNTSLELSSAGFPGRTT